MMQQQGNKNILTGSPQKVHGTALSNGVHSYVDEFKYGFPSDGLSSVSYRWWGDSVPNDSKSSKESFIEEYQDKKNSLVNLVHSDIQSSTNDRDGCEKNTDKGDIDFSGTGSLTALRKKAVEEGQEALRLGLHQRHGINGLNQTEKTALLHVFKSSLPSGWRD